MELFRRKKQIETPTSGQSPVSGIPTNKEFIDSFVDSGHLQPYHFFVDACTGPQVGGIDPEILAARTEAARLRIAAEAGSVALDQI